MPKLTKFLILIFSIFFLTTPAFAQTPISYGQTISGSINAAGEKDEFSFSGTAGDAITIRFLGTSGNLYPALELFNPSGDSIAYSDYLALDTILTSTGTFKLVVQDVYTTGTGTYEFTLQCTNNPGNAATINFGQTVSGDIAKVIGIDAYKFTASAGDKICINFTTVSTTSGSFDPYLELYDANGVKVAEGYYSGPLTATAAAAGNFYLLVSDSYLDGTGNYEFTLQRANNPANAATINFGQTVSASIANLTEIDAYKFTASAGDKICINFTVISTASGSFDPYLELYDANGVKVGEASSFYSGQLTATAVNSGNLYLLVSDNYLDGKGDYEFTLQCTNNPANAAAIDFGQTISADIAKFTELDVYKFTASAGDKIYINFTAISTTSGSFDPYLEFYDANGVKVGEATYAGQIIATAATTGNFYLLISDSSLDGKGAYEFTIQRANNPGNAAAINFGQTVSGDIAKVIGIDAYKFTASAGDKICINFTTVSTTSGSFDPYLELYDANGVKIAETYYSGQIIATAATTGNFYLLISDSSLDGKGAYEFTIQRANNPANAATINFGQTVSSNIANLTEIDAYKFTASAGDKIYINFTTVSTTSGSFDPYLELYDANGVKIGDASYSGPLTVTAAAAGNCYLLISDNYLDGKGDYEFTIQRANNPANVKTLSYNVAQNGSLNDVTGINAYKFTASSGDKITICSAVKTETSGNFDVYLELYDTAGTRLAYNSNSLQYTFTAGGTFYLFITDYYRDGTGTYRFILKSGTISCSDIDLVDPTVTLLQPKSGEVIESGSTYNISWESSDNVGITSQNIKLSTDSGATYPTVIVSGLGESVQSYDWQVPANLSTIKARIKITCSDAASNLGESANNADFAIINTALPANSVGTTYEYDKNNRLIKSASPVFASLSRYTYDALGSRLGLNVTNSLPILGTITPSSGTSASGMAANITTTYSDPNGYKDIATAGLLINTSIKYANGACLLYYPITNKLYLYNDSGTAKLGGFAPGSANTIENSYCRLNCAKTAISGSGNNLSVTWNIAFKSAFTGVKKSYLYATDKSNVSVGWTEKGSWTINP